MALQYALGCDYAPKRWTQRKSALSRPSETQSLSMDACPIALDALVRLTSNHGELCRKIDSGVD